MLLNEPICFLIFSSQYSSENKKYYKSKSTSADRFLSTTDDVAKYRMEYFLDTSPDF